MLMVTPEVIVILDSSDDSNGLSIPSVPVYGPSVQGLLDTYGYENYEDYLSDFYFPSTDKEDTIVHTGQDPIHECHSPKSKAKYVPVSHKHKPNVKSPNAITRCVLGLPNVDTWDDILNKFGMRTPGRCADNWMNGKDYGKDNHHVFCIYSSDDSKGVSSKGPSITSIPKEGPSTAKLSKEPIPKELLAWYGYDIVEDYLPVAEKPIPKVIFKSHIPIKRCVLGLANVETWDNIVKKYGMRTPGRCADKSKGKRKIPVTGCVLGLANVTTWDEIEKKIGLADILLLQEFNIEIKDKKGTENVAANHLSRIENDETSVDSEFNDSFPGETLMEINTKNEPWFADFANYLVENTTPSMRCSQERVRLNTDVKALDAGSVITESSRTKSDKHDTSSNLRNYITHDVDADIRPVNDQVPFAEVQLTAQHNVLANEQQHTEQSEPICDTYLLEKDVEHDQVKSPLLKDEFLKTNDMVEKEVYNELSNRFLQLEKHCISLEISIQQKEESFQSNKPCKNQDSPEFREFFEINELKAQLQAKNSTINNLKEQIKNVHEKSNEAKVKHDIDVIETINIELEHKVAKLLQENEHLKQTYKELYDSIKKTRIQTKDHNDSLIAQVNSKTVENADLKAQIQEKVFANVALKNELRKLKGNNMDTKFAKPSILGKPVLQPPRNQSVVRQPNAFKSERPNFSKPRFASQVDVNNVLSKPVTPHYLPKVREYVLAKPHHVIAPGSFRNSQEEPYGSNDMAHNHYLEEARKKTQERNRNSKPSVMHTTSLQNTTNGSKPNTRSNNQISRSLPVSKSSCGMSNGLALQRQNDVCSHQFRPRSSTINGVCRQHFRPRCSKKRKVYASVRFIFGRREIFLCLTILINMIHAFSMLVLLSSGSTSGPGPQLLTPRTISSGLVPQPPSPTPNVPPTKNDWDSLFCPMFDEYFNPSPSVVQHVLVAVVQEPVVSTGTPSSTRIDQDTPSTSTSQTTQEEQSHVIPTSVKEDNHGIKVAHMDNDL
ncbi:hypothetical protein Tco_0625727 [Tanacetum coccineum]|uniref:Uncharacterized protein n=1 Tax=Tanacetum coccineum TaxID=301880 RepID=A0ABQ4WHK4_9ASTR